MVTYGAATFVFEHVYFKSVSALQFCSLNDFLFEGSNLDLNELVVMMPVDQAILSLIVA